MKAQILKLGGVTSEKAFYKKFPTEEAFMKIHGKELEKLFTGGEAMTPIQGRNLPTGNPFETLDTKTLDPMGSSAKSSSFDIGSIANPAMEVGKGIMKLIEEKKQRKIAEQWRDVSNVALKASRTRPEEMTRRYVRPEDMIMEPGQLNDPYGEGTNILQGKQGVKIKGKPLTRPGVSPTLSDYPNATKEEQRAHRLFPYPTPEDVELMHTKEQSDSAMFVKGYRSPETIQEVWPDGLVIDSPYEGGFYNKVYDEKRLKELPGKVNFTTGKVKNMKKGGEIQNTYDPNDLYKDLEYEPLQAETGWMGPAGDMISKGIDTFGGENAGGDIGGTIGGTVGSIFGPAGQLIGKVGGQLLGRALDGNVRKMQNAKEQTDANLAAMSLGEQGQGLQRQYSSFMETGGKVQDSTMELGGDLKLYEGDAEVISSNPYLPDGGETVMFQGPPHTRGGMDISFGGKPVEVEGGEPAVKLKNGSGENDNLVVFGNLPIDNVYLPLLGDPDAKGKKFKNYVADLSKKEERQNNITKKSSEELSELNVSNSIDRLTEASYKANLLGANMKLKDLADKKNKAAYLQQAINDTAEEKGVDAEYLAKGKVKARRGISIAEDGKSFTIGNKTMIPEKLTKENYDFLMKQYEEAKAQGNGPLVEQFQKNFHIIMPNRSERILSEYPVTTYGKTKGITSKDLQSNEDSIFGKRTERYLPELQDALQEEEAPLTYTAPGAYTEDPSLNMLNQPIKVTDEIVPSKKVRNKFPFMEMINGALPYLRPSDSESLNPRQLSGEMFALSTNQLEPVRAQSFQPDLSTPYDISYQDILNENQADFRGASRLMGGNPAAQAYLNSQKYGANQKVLGEQFRVNQAQKDKVYSENRNLLNTAKLKNLEIYDNQYTRQETAKSNTKATTLAALNSISDKFSKNQLENKTLQMYENLYNYRYDNKGRAINMNPLAVFNTEGSLDPSIGAPVAQGRQYTYTTDSSGNLVKEDIKAKPKNKSRNGNIIHALRNL